MLALAAAALAVPALPGTASAAAVPSAASATVTTLVAPAPQARHHLTHGLFASSPNTVTFQTWSASGWSLTMPGSEVEPRCLEIPHHHRCTPWEYRPAPKGLSGPEPDSAASGTYRPGIESYHISHLNPRNLGDFASPDTGILSAEPDVSTGTTAGLMTPADAPIPDLPRHGAPAAPAAPAALAAPAAQTPQTPQLAQATPVTRSRPLATKTPTATATTSAMAPARPASVSLANRIGSATKKPMSSPCLRATYLAGKDRRMLAHLRPPTDAMNVVVAHPRAECAAMVDYLSQSRA
ncbi:hypothetical protein [Catenulispora yoronensis]|uniref:hypothetical protein n=1 Tax=Catenulispora yoronensis TaxID=450799 RepID=UPI0031E48623